MVAKFVSSLSPEYSVAKAYSVIGDEISTLIETYNRLSRLQISLNLLMSPNHLQWLLLVDVVRDLATHMPQWSVQGVVIP